MTSISGGVPSSSSIADSSPDPVAQPLWRLATRADLPGIVDIYNSTVASRMVTADTEPVTPASREVWFDVHTPQRRPLWVVDDQAHPGQLSGWLSFSDFYGRPAYGRTAEVLIYLAPAARGRGLGASLLAGALGAAPALGIDTVLGFIFGHNAPSLALFNKAGFATWGHLPNIAVLDGVERDLIILGKRLQP